MKCCTIPFRLIINCFDSELINGCAVRVNTVSLLGVNFLPHELQSSISELREIEVNSKIEGVCL